MKNSKVLCLSWVISTCLHETIKSADQVFSSLPGTHVTSLKRFLQNKLNFVRVPHYQEAGSRT